jgi:hypothetical protein
VSNVNSLSSGQNDGCACTKADSSSIRGSYETLFKLKREQQRRWRHCTMQGWNLQSRQNSPGRLLTSRRRREVDVSHW